MAQNNWEFVWANSTNTQTYLNCIDERVVNSRLNQPTTCELKIPLDTPEGRQILADNGWGYILVYRNGSLHATLETISSDVGPASAEGIPSIALVGNESGFERLDSFLVSTTGAPHVFPATSGQVCLRLSELLYTLNGDATDATINNVGLKSMASPPVSATVLPSSFEPGLSFLALIQALAFRGSGFDFWIDPAATTLYTNSPGKSGPYPCVGTLMMASVRGVARPSASFGYGPGTRGNLVDYSYKRLGGEHLANQVYVPSSGTSGGNAAGVAVSAASSRIGTGYRMRWVTSDFDDKALRQTLADDHITYRAAPRRLLTITPNVDTGGGFVPSPFTDYGIGDFIPVTINELGADNAINIAAGTLRVYGIKITLDKDNKETVEIETTPEGVPA